MGKHIARQGASYVRATQPGAQPEGGALHAGNEQPPTPQGAAPRRCASEWHHLGVRRGRLSCSVCYVFFTTLPFFSSFSTAFSCTARLVLSPIKPTGIPFFFLFCLTPPPRLVLSITSPPLSYAFFFSLRIFMYDLLFNLALFFVIPVPINLLTRAQCAASLH